MGSIGETQAMKFIIDTSLVIDKLRGGSRWDTFLRVVEKDAELFLPTVVIYELYSGQSTKQQTIRNKIQDLVKFFQRVDLTGTVAKRSGELYRDAKEHFSLADYVIAATAMELGAEVVTLNKKHFEKISGVRIFDFENEI